MEEQYQPGNYNDTNELPDKHITIDEFIDIVDVWTEGFTSPIWRYFGTLSASGCEENELCKRFLRWSSLIERETGNSKFRLVAGVERLDARHFDLHFFMGGVNSDTTFDATWSSQWLELGGTKAFIQQLTWRYVEEYLKYFKHHTRCKHVRLIARLHHTPRRYV